MDMNYLNIKFLYSGDFSEAEGFYDSIIVAAGADLFPVDLFAKLENGGTLIIPVKNESGHQIKKFIKKNENKIIEESIGEAVFVPLIIEENFIEKKVV